MGERFDCPPRTSRTPGTQLHFTAPGLSSAPESAGMLPGLVGAAGLDIPYSISCFRRSCSFWNDCPHCRQRNSLGCIPSTSFGQFLRPGLSLGPLLRGNRGERAASRWRRDRVPEEERNDHEDHREHSEEVADLGRHARNSAEAENGSDQCDHEETQCPRQHVIPPFHLCPLFAASHGLHC
jgi:hypothetical protein